MNKKIIFLLFLSIILLNIKPLFAEDLVEQVREILRSRIELAGNPMNISVAGEVITASEALPQFYIHRVYKPVWIDSTGVKLEISNLINSIYEADKEGLNPQDYHILKIEELLLEILTKFLRKDKIPSEKLADLEMLLTDAFLVYGSHLYHGRLNPETFYSEWAANRGEIDMATELRHALSTHQISEKLESFLPPKVGYDNLRKGLEKYKKYAKDGGWKPIPKFEGKLEKGDSTEVLRAVRKRLYFTEDLAVEPKGDSTDFYFDETLEEGIKNFQTRHGLEVDGVIGKSTLRELNISVEERIFQIQINMERWRWLPQDLGDEYIIANIAAFHLYVYENNEPTLDMKVIVGEEYNRTPVFSDSIRYLVLNPYWHVPIKIAKREILPKIKEAPSYLQEKNMEVYKGRGGEIKAITPETVVWDTVNSANYDFWFKQRPGPQNSLGRIKFMFPNKYEVYLHDTPQKFLFEKPVRTFSHGCMRLEKPIELAAYLLRGNKEWTQEKIEKFLEISRETRSIELPKPMSIHILYWTAWAESDATVHFRSDVYGRDQKLIQALCKAHPSCERIKEEK